MADSFGCSCWGRVALFHPLADKVHGPADNNRRRSHSAASRPRCALFFFPLVTVAKTFWAFPPSSPARIWSLFANFCVCADLSHVLGRVKPRPAAWHPAGAAAPRHTRPGAGFISRTHLSYVRIDTLALLSTAHLGGDCVPITSPGPTAQRVLIRAKAPWRSCLARRLTCSTVRRSYPLHGGLAAVYTVARSLFAIHHTPSDRQLASFAPDAFLCLPDPTTPLGDSASREVHFPRLAHQPRGVAVRDPVTHQLAAIVLLLVIRTCTPLPYENLGPGLARLRARRAAGWAVGRQAPCPDRHGSCRSICTSSKLPWLLGSSERQTPSARAALYIPGRYRKPPWRAVPPAARAGCRLPVHLPPYFARYLFGRR